MVQALRPLVPYAHARLPGRVRVPYPERACALHPPAGAAGQVAESDPKNRELMAKQENALQQLVLMALNDDTLVVEQAAATLREWWWGAERTRSV